MRKIIALVKHMIFGWKIMAAVKIVTDWIFLFGFSFIQCHVTSFPYLDCTWGWSLQNIKQLCWSCLHCFLDFGLIHHQDHLMYKIYPSNWAVTTWLNLIPTCFTCTFLFSKKHRKKKVRQKSSSESDDESEGKVLPTDKNDAQFEYLVWPVFLNQVL